MRMYHRPHRRRAGIPRTQPQISDEGISRKCFHRHTGIIIRSVPRKYCSGLLCIFVRSHIRSDCRKVRLTYPILTYSYDNKCQPLSGTRETI